MRKDSATTDMMARPTNQGSPRTSGAPPAAALLDVRGLNVTYSDASQPTVHDVSFTVAPGEKLGIIGASGSGKSLCVLSLIGLKPARTRVEGAVIFCGHTLNLNDDVAMSRIRGSQVGMVFQEPLTALDPTLTIGTQLVTALRTHGNLRRARARSAAIKLAALIELPDPKHVIDRYPSELSGGQRQRVVIGMAMSCQPQLVIADEPTSALDSVTARRTLDVMVRLSDRLGSALIFVTHDIALAASACDRILVMDRGSILQDDTTEHVLAHPAEPYTRDLIDAARAQSTPLVRTQDGTMPLITVPLDTLQDSERQPVPVRTPHTQSATGQPSTVGASSVNGGRSATDTLDAGAPSIGEPGTGVPSVGGSGTGNHNAAERSTAGSRSGTVEPSSGTDMPVLLAATHLSLRSSSTGHMRIDDVSVNIKQSETLGIIGSSGSGKTTLLSLLTGQIAPTSGSVTYAGRPVTVGGYGAKPWRRDISLVMQDPASSLAPAMTVSAIVAEPVRLLEKRRMSIDEATELLATVGLDSSMLARYPHELSGGQRQRVAIARALATQPQILIADEPVSALDVLTRERLIDLLARVVSLRHLTLVMVSHDLASVARLADRTIVMDQGRIVEDAATARILHHPIHPVTQALVAAVPRLARSEGV
ncbi:MAG: ABC transporter ATP-binding protein [Actinomycetaceae bacterium]|nr:ABC transporter ATP-binding protein [Actinomycetaceae bacterium]MDY6082894.1 ABC transporter ATP-binding protein [Actinomycetaceae bacterium]